MSTVTIKVNKSSKKENGKRGTQPVFSFEETSNEIDEYLSDIPISEDDPAVLFAWDDPAVLFAWDLDALIEFTAYANAARVNQRNPVPAWLTSIPPNINQVTLTTDIMAYLAVHAGGRCKNVMLAPNTMSQSHNVIRALSDIEYDPFIQNCMGQLRPGVFLGEIYYLSDQTVVRAYRAQLASPIAPLRQVFQ